MSREDKRSQHYIHATNDPRADLASADFNEVCADVNLEYGGTFVRPEIMPFPDQSPHYAGIIEITDLAGACGASGLNLIELKSVSLEFKRDQTLIKELDRALETMGQTRRSIADIARNAGKNHAYAYIAFALASYGAATDVEQSWLAVTDADAAHGSREAYQWIGRNVRRFGQYAPCDVIPDYGDAALSLAINAAISAA